jgi:uncharacterized membrane protein (UPF0127 family)
MDIKINNNLFNVKCVLTSHDIQNGMMFRKFDTFDGMLFMMDNEDHHFWMKNCIIPLDIIFIENNKITKIHHNCQPCRSNDCERYDGFGDMVLELHGNQCKKYGIKDGDQIEII